MKVNSAHELLKWIKPGNRVFVHGAAATPISLLQSLSEEHRRLPGTEIMHLHTHGAAPYADQPEFKVINLFVGENIRTRLDYSRVDYLPCFLSEIPQLFRKSIRRPDVAIVQVSPPDASGYCSLGTSVDIAKAAVDTASIVLAQVNSKMPRTHGDGMFPFSRVTAFWEHEEELSGPVARPPSPTEKAIADHVAALIEDGATLQIGVGAVPDAVMARLSGHKNLGVHTETFSDGLLPLLECGAIDNSLKHCHKNRSVTSFVSGSAKLYEFVHDNPAVVFLESDYVNDLRTIARNPRVVALNSAVEVDLTGQVVADSIGPRVISGVGGQMDFVRGASLSEGGKAIIALPSRTKSGKSRIAANLQLGAGVVTTRAHVHFIATEFGVADLYGRALGERAKAMIEIAHPEDREGLERAWFERFLPKNKE
ncbi:MAG: acetyl-CoA hydrolase/transferase family protein [Bdellovibrionota bacterium]